MIYLADTNVLLRLVEPTHSLHMAVRSAVNSLRKNGSDIHITTQNCIEFWNVITRLANNNGLGIKPSDAEPLLDLLERLFPILADTPTIYLEWRRLVIAYAVAGVKVHDARLVASMKVHGVTHILTLNPDDFKRYARDGIVTVDPLTVL